MLSKFSPWNDYIDGRHVYNERKPENDCTFASPLKLCIMAISKLKKKNMKNSIVKIPLGRRQLLSFVYTMHAARVLTFEVWVQFKPSHQTTQGAARAIREYWFAHIAGVRSRFLMFAVSPALMHLYLLPNYHLQPFPKIIIVWPRYDL